MIFIQEVKAREILESRGLPTIEVEILLSDESKYVASAPSGTSYGSEEMIEVRDKDMSRYLGNGVLRAVETVNKTIAPRLYKKEPIEQFDLDELILDLDGTPNRSHLGVNTILAVSMAIAKAGAGSRKESLFVYIRSLYETMYNRKFKVDDAGALTIEQMQEISPMRPLRMPEPIFNMINGRESENSKLDIQDFMIILKGVNEYADKIRFASEIDHHIQKLLAGSDYYYTSLSNEGGATPDVDSDMQALEIIDKAIAKLDPRVIESVYFGLDIAATGLYKPTTKKYSLDGRTKEVTSEEMVTHMLKFMDVFPVIFFEDPLADKDYEGWKLFAEKMPNYIGLVGDDLFTSSQKNLERNKKEKWANAISMKPNQIGTLTEILSTSIMAQQQEMKVMVSHRSGETNDDYISDLAVAIGAEYLKSGAPRKGERVAKYNRLLRIKEELDIINKTKA